MSDYQILNSIEKYDVVTDTWISLYFKLPMPLAKLASVALGSKHILIIGGMSADFEEASSRLWINRLNGWMLAGNMRITATA